jgi:hypothetical protein
LDLVEVSAGVTVAFPRLPGRFDFSPTDPAGIPGIFLWLGYVVALPAIQTTAARSVAGHRAL